METPSELPSSNTETTFYKTLLIENFSNVEEIKKAYRKLILKYHPDKLCGLDSST